MEAGTMDHPLRRPEEILAYRSLKQILKPKALWSVGPADSVLTAAQVMADKNIGFLVVLDNGAIVGVLSERDCVRRAFSDVCGLPGLQRDPVRSGRRAWRRAADGSGACRADVPASSWRRWLVS